MTLSETLYRFGSQLFEPIIPALLRDRASKGKERLDRIEERMGRSPLARPAGVLIWLHGASVGESRLLLDVFTRLRQRRSDIAAVLTTQTLTSADMVASRGRPGLIHQMAPVDTPGSVTRFLDHWRPDTAVFAEGEIWPNMLGQAAARNIPAALVNARMTARTLQGWRSRRAAARSVFSAFNFIGAADQATRDGLADILGRRIDVVGNLKQAAETPKPDPGAVARWRAATGQRPTLLAASTHPGEDEFAFDAFQQVRRARADALLVIAPRHPDRGAAIAELARTRGHIVQLRSANAAAPVRDVDVLVADTMGELLFWYACADAVYLGGATAEQVGGHNAIEPVQLGKRVWTGPNGYNFREIFADLERSGALTVGETTEELAAFWLESLADGGAPPKQADALFAGARAPMEASIAAILALLPAGAAPHA